MDRRVTPEPRRTQSRRLLRTKLVRVMIGTMSLVTVLVIATVAGLHTRYATITQTTIQAKIRDSIIRKGQALVTNHATALRGLVEDNAFGDIRGMIEATLAVDDELAFGLFIDRNGEPWAYVSPNALPGQDNRQAWQELGLAPATILRTAKAPVVQRELFGQQIFQFSAPVLTERRSLLGAITYGVWAAPLNSALAGARQEARQSFRMALIVLSGLAIASLLVGRVLVGRAASHITRPLQELMAVTTSLARGQRHLRVSITSGDEIESLGASFNTMMTELDASYERLESLNRTLEQRVEDRTRQLAERTEEVARRNRDLRLVLDNVNEGLLTISRDGILADERSAAVDRWFGGYAPGTTFVQLMEAIDREFARLFALGFDTLLEDVMPREVTLGQLPRRLHHDGRHYDCLYAPLPSREALTGLLVTITDVTDQWIASQHEVEQQELLALIQGLMRNRALFLSFFREATDLVEGIASGDNDGLTLRRLVHTLKGNASLASLSQVARLCHELEDRLEDDDERGAAGKIQALRERWSTLQGSLRQLLGDRSSELVEVEAREIERLHQEVMGPAPRSEVADRIMALRYTPLGPLFDRLAEYGQALAQRLGRSPLQVVVEDDGIRLDPARWGQLCSELVHLIRNAVDHGLEPARERRASGKPDEGRLRLHAELRDATLRFEIEDDGRGIDWAALAAAAAANGLPAKTQRDLVAALFGGGLSSRTEVTVTSGRGMGMSALHQQVEALGGEVTVTGAPRAGTCWKLTFPALGVARLSPGARGQVGEWVAQAGMG